jgi:hypothetical protein
MPYTLGQVRTLVRQRADIEGSTFITDAEIDLYVWDSMFELFEVLLAVGGIESIMRESDVQIRSTDASAALPTLNGRGPYKIVRVDTPFNGLRRPMGRYNAYAETRDDNAHTWNEGTQLQYIVASGNVSVLPRPSATTTCRLYWIPFPDQPLTATDPINYVSPWEEYITIDAAIKCKEKEESDTTALERAKANMIVRIDRWMAVFDRNPLTIGDVRGDFEDTEWG